MVVDLIMRDTWCARTLPHGLLGPLGTDLRENILLVLFECDIMQ
jgi:hypothetical protein